MVPWETAAPDWCMAEEYPLSVEPDWTPDEVSEGGIKWANGITTGWYRQHAQYTKFYNK